MERKIKAIVKVIDTCDYRLHESCGRYCPYWGMCLWPLEDFLEWIIRDDFPEENLEKIEKMDKEEILKFLNKISEE